MRRGQPLPSFGLGALVTVLMVGAVVVLALAL
jgi:hypothetical protein